MLRRALVWAPYYITILNPACQSFHGKRKGAEVSLPPLIPQSGPLVLIPLVLALILLFIVHLGSLRLRLRVGILVSGLHVLTVVLVLHDTHLAFAVLILPQFLRIIRKIFLVRGYHRWDFYGIILSNPHKGGSPL